MSAITPSGGCTGPECRSRLVSVSEFRAPEDDAPYLWLARARAALDAVNDRPFLGHPAGTVRLEDFGLSLIRDTERPDVGHAERSLTVAHRPGGWGHPAPPAADLTALAAGLAYRVEPVATAPARSLNVGDL